MRELARKLLDVLEYDEIAARLRPFLVRVANGVLEQVVGYKILLYSPGEVVRSYEVDEAGLTAALAAAVSGDHVDLPGACAIGGSHVVPGGVTLGARGGRARLTGPVTMGAGAGLRDLAVEITGSGTLAAVVGPDSGEAFVRGCYLSVESSDGDAVGVLGAAGDLLLWDCRITAEGATGAAAIESHGGKIRARYCRLEAGAGGALVNPVRVESYTAAVNETLLQGDRELGERPANPYIPKAWDSKNDGTPADWNLVDFDDSGWGEPYIHAWGTWYGPWANDAAVLYRIYLDLTNVISVNSVVVYTAVDDTNNIYLNGVLVRANGPGFEDNADITGSVNLGEMNLIGFEMTNSGGDLWCAWNVAVNWTETRWNAPELYGCVLGGYTSHEAGQGDRAAWDASGYAGLHANDVDDEGIHHTLGALDGRYSAGAHTHGARTENVLAAQGATGPVLKDSHVKDGMSGGYLAELAAVLTGNRVYTLQDSDMVLAALNLAQSWTADQVVSARLAVGAGAAINTNQTLVVSETHSSVDANKTGLSVAARAEPTASNARGYFGAVLTARLAGGYNLTRSLGGLIGLYGQVAHEGSGTVAFSYSHGGLVSVSGGGTITSHANFYVLPPVVSSGSIGTLYGLLVPDLTAGGTNYAIYTGAGRVRLGGPVGIGIDSPAAGYMLDVAGFVTTNQTVDQATYPSVYAVQNATTLQNLSANTGTTETMDQAWEAVKFTASGNHAVRSFGARLKVDSVLTNPTGYLNGYIYSDSAGSPGTQISSGVSNVYYGSLTTSFTEFHFVSSAVLTSGTDYWVVLKQSTAPAGGVIQIDTKNSGTGLYANSTNGTSWMVENNKVGWVKLYGRTYYGVYGTSAQSYGVRGNSTNDYGVYGSSGNTAGVAGQSTFGSGVRGISNYVFGVHGSSTYSYGVYGSSQQLSGAAFFQTGTLTAHNANPVLLLRRNLAGSYNATGNMLQLTDNPTNSGTRAGALISGQIDSTERLRFDARVVDGASAVGAFVDTANTLSNAGAKLLSLRNNGTEKAFVRADGGGYFEGSTGVGTSSPSSKLDVAGSVEVGSGDYFYLGDPGTDGSWRIGRSGDNLVSERRESGSWVTKQTITP